MLGYLSSRMAVAARIMWLLVLAIRYGSATMGPQVFATEDACIAAGESKSYMGRQVKFVCQRVER